MTADRHSPHDQPSEETHVKWSTRLRLWLIDHLPAGLLFQPAEALLAFIGIVSGLRFVTTGADSASIQALLPPPVVTVWGVLLFVGSAALMSGLLSFRRVEGGRFIIARVPAYRLGLRLLGLSAAVFGGAVLAYAQTAGLLAAMFPLAFSAMCALRLLSLGGR
jgi:hypothetical protein